LKSIGIAHVLTLPINFELFSFFAMDYATEA